MLEAQKAAFSFESFKVPKFYYDEGNHQGSELKLGFLPSGVFNSATREFELTLMFITHDAENEDRVIFELKSVAIFKFVKDLKKEEIPPYFYRNAIAIMFPYVRSFISTLTLQANTKLLKLGLMNLEDLETPLKENTVLI